MNFPDLAYLSIGKFGNQDIMLLSQLNIGNGAKLGMLPGLKNAIQDDNISSQ